MKKMSPYVKNAHTFFSNCPHISKYLNIHFTDILQGFLCFNFYNALNTFFIEYCIKTGNTFRREKAKLVNLVGSPTTQWAAPI